MATVHSEMKRSELLITSQEHRNIWIRTWRSLSAGEPLAYTVISHSLSSFLHQSNTLHSYFHGLSCSTSPQACADHVLTQHDLAQTLYSLPSPIRYMGSRDLPIPCISSGVNGERSLITVHLGPQIVKRGPPWPCFPWEHEPESHQEHSVTREVSLLPVLIC